MPNTYRSYQEFYSGGPYANYLVEHRLAGSSTVRLLHVEQPSGEFPDPPLPEFILYVAVRGARELSFDWGFGRWIGAWHPNDVSIAPPDIGTRIHVDTPHAFLAVALPRALVTTALDEFRPNASHDLGALHATTFRNGFVVRLCHTLWRHAVAARGQYTLQTDGLILALLATLGRELGLAPQSSNQTCLDGGPLKRVIEHVEENLARNVPLAELAATAGLSPTHFARQFRRVTGTSPHQYLLKRRLRRAGLLLSTTTHPLTDIAAEAGFASQAHMTSIFSRNLGVTPARYRAICAT